MVSALPETDSLASLCTCVNLGAKTNEVAMNIELEA